MKDKSNKSRDRFVRITYGFLALFLIMLGGVHIFSGSLTYENFKGLGVFAPVTVIIGLILLYGVIFQWGLLRDADKKRNGEENKNDSTKTRKD